jgi:quercetin dioxygenase-like cupin family protein
MDFASTLAALRAQGLRLDRIAPADDPAEAVLSGDGVSVVLRREGWAGLPEVGQHDGSIVTARAGGDEVVGRAGMRYRDLVPGRWGGAVIASHITIPDGGPVPDDVHAHEIGFQVICCRSGWVRVVYEDQGPPFTLEAGDVVLQPPGIRHRVLDASPGLQVVEVGSPAAHPTLLDHEVLLPTPAVQPERDFGGQRFVRHVSASSAWTALADGWDEQRTGVAPASHGAGAVRLLRSTGAAPLTWTTTDAFTLLYLTGGATAELSEDDSLALPAGSEVTLTPSVPTSVLEVTVATAGPPGI